MTVLCEFLEKIEALPEMPEVFSEKATDLEALRRKNRQALKVLWARQRDRRRPKQLFLW